MTAVSVSCPGTHPRCEAVDENLGSLPDLHRVEADDLLGETIRHFEQDGCASLRVKLPAFIDGATADELPAQLGGAVFDCFDLCQELPRFQLAKLWRIRQAIAAPVGKVALPCSHIVVAGREGWRIMPLAGAVNRSDISSD